MNKAEIYVDAFMRALAGENVELNPQLQQIFGRILSRQVTIDDSGQVELNTSFYSLLRVFTYVATTYPDDRPDGGPLGYSTLKFEQAKISAQEAINLRPEAPEDIDLFSLGGTLMNAVLFNAGESAFNLTDDVAFESNTVITHFGRDDQLIFKGVIASDVKVSVSNGNTEFQFDNGRGIVSQITLVGVDGFFTSVEEFNSYSGLGEIVFA